MDRLENRTADRSRHSEQPKISRNFDICFHFRVICKKLLVYPYVLFLVTAAMFLTRRTYRTQFII